MREYEENLVEDFTHLDQVLIVKKLEYVGRNDSDYSNK
jgi:hypothetical protein